MQERNIAIMQEMQEWLNWRGGTPRRNIWPEEEEVICAWRPVAETGIICAGRPVVETSSSAAICAGRPAVILGPPGPPRTTPVSPINLWRTLNPPPVRIVPEETRIHSDSSSSTSSDTHTVTHIPRTHTAELSSSRHAPASEAPCLTLREVSSAGETPCEDHHLRGETPCIHLLGETPCGKP